MFLDFRKLAILSSVIFFCLAIVWLLAPQFFLSNWRVEVSSSSVFIGQLSAALYTGIAVMLFMAKESEPSSARLALITGFVVACLLLAGFEIYQLASGHTDSGILFAILIELALAAAFIYVTLPIKNRVLNTREKSQ